MEWFGSVSFHQQLPQQQSSTAMMHGLWRSLRFQPQQQQRNYFCCYSCVRPLVYFHTLDYPKNFHRIYQFLFKFRLFWDFNAHSSSFLSLFPLTHHHSRSLTLRHHILTTKFHISPHLYELVHHCWAPKLIITIPHSHLHIEFELKNEAEMLHKIKPYYRQVFLR